MLSKLKSFLSRHRYKILAGVSFMVGGYFLYQYAVDESQVKLSSFIEAVKLGQIDEVIVESQTIFFRSQNSDWYRTFCGRFPINEIFALIKNKDIIFSTREPAVSNETVSAGIAIIGSAIAFKFMWRQMNKPEVSNANLSSGIYHSGTSFDDFYGGQNIKLKFREIIDFLRQPKKYEKMGARIRRGVLFYGPPGTGKTMLARALANEAGCEFIRVVASQFQQIFVGVGPKRVRELFQNARKCQNGCIIFIDEIDALGSRMNHLRDSHETTSTINQFLSEMDGFAPLDRVVIVAATNRIDLVDHAILRAGRFDVKVQIPLPNIQQRRGIFCKLLQKRLKHHDIDEATIDQVSKKSENWCGADLQTLLNESIYRAIQQNKEILQPENVKDALQEVLMRR